MSNARPTPWILNGFAMNSVGHISAGLWRHPADQAERHVTLGHWTGLAALLEQGGFDTLFLEDVPVLTPDRREAARRFVTLIDTLYEAHARLIVLAAAEPDALYPKGVGAFEFERTASRLHEMRSRDWLKNKSRRRS